MVKKLSSISNGTDIRELQPCIYPGGHCPLFGVHLTLGSITGVTMLVIGTADCGFYAYKTMNNFAGPFGQGARLRCAVLEESDVINGCEEGLTTILNQLAQDEETRLIVVITSCVIELTGEDIAGIVHEVQSRFSTPISVIRTENFKTADYLQGVEQAMASVSPLLRPIPYVPKSFSVLGPRFPGIEKDPVIQKLFREGYGMVTQFPFKTDIKAIKRIPGSSFVIVTEETAAKLARGLESRFRIPFVEFTPSPFHTDNLASLERLSDLTGISFIRDLEAEEKKIKKLRARLRHLYKDKNFIIGNVTGSPFVVAWLIADIGGNIELILARNIYETDRNAVAKLLKLGQDPLVAKNANIAAMQRFSTRSKADFHIGMGWGRTTETPGIRLISMGTSTPNIGAGFRKSFYQNLLEQSEIP